MPTSEEVIQQTEEPTISEPIVSEDTEPRSVSVLLNILDTEGTYQGMTDAEIQSIVDFKTQISYQKGCTDASIKAHEQYQADRLAMTQKSLQAEEDMLKSIVERASNPVLQVVQYG